MNDDDIFWDRLADMPAWEAEQECVMRREAVILRFAMLTSEKAKAKTNDEAARIGVAIAQDSGQLSLLNERIKYLRKLQSRIEWKEAVRVLYGDDAVDQCVTWMQQQYNDIHEKRKEWR